jgi:hypothetical protein
MGYFPIDYRDPSEYMPDQKWFCPHCLSENLDNASTQLLMCSRCNAIDLDWSEVLSELPEDRAVEHHVQRTACADCKVLVFEGEETMFYCAKHEPKEDTEFKKNLNMKPQRLGGEHPFA